MAPTPSSDAAGNVVLWAKQLDDNARKYINNVALLNRVIAAADSTDGDVKAAVQALKLFYVDALHKRDIEGDTWKKVPSDDAAAAKAKYTDWLKKQHSKFCSSLLELLRRGGRAQATEAVALTALMECVRGQEPGALDTKLLRSTVKVLLESTQASGEVRGFLVGKYAAYADVRYHLLKAVEATADEASRKRRRAGGEAEEDVVHNVYDVLMNMPGKYEGTVEAGSGRVEGVASWSGLAEAGRAVAASDRRDSARARKRRRGTGEEEKIERGGVRVRWGLASAQQAAFSGAWLAFLRMPLPRRIFKKVLQHLHSAVLPELTNPLLLSDFLTASLDGGGLEGMLALNSIFLLVTQHGLEYPGFYQRLYALLTPDALRATYHARFLQLADVFLASGLVPAYTAAAFAKRFARLALTASPAAAVAALAFVHNILRRHPSCLVMLHRPPTAAAAPVSSGEDVYDDSAADPAESRAVESSLWEVASLKQHASAQVAAAAAWLDRDLSNRVRTKEVDIQPLCAQSYASILHTELAKRLKRAVATALYPRGSEPSRVFASSCRDNYPGFSVE